MTRRGRKILFLVPYPSEGASARLRVEQFVPSLRQAGIECKVRPFLTTSFYRILYKRGNTVRKVFLFLFCVCRRASDLARAVFYDVIFIHREALPVGLPVVEALLFLLNKKVIFDFDDAIYLPPEGSSPLIAFLKCPWKTGFIIRHSRAVIAGNDYLRRYAERFNGSITVIPTCIDTERYHSSRPGRSPESLVIGWIGSHTTQVFLKSIREVLFGLLKRYDNLAVHLVGAQPGVLNHERVVVKRWSVGSELDDIRQFDIGVMPMPDTEWTRGKCAFKAILYMSLEMPVVASRVGVNREIVKDGSNGFLASSGKEWEEKLLRLIEDGSLRRSLGASGRATVEREFSLRTNAPLFCDLLKKI